MTRNVARILIALRKLRRRMERFDILRVWFFAVVIGAAAAYGVIGFRHAIDAVSQLAFGETEAGMVSGAAAHSFWRDLSAPLIGGLVVAVMLYAADRFKFLVGGHSQGIADVIEARAVGDSRVSLRAGLVSAAVSAVSLGAGASAGREGPAVHLGATTASILSRYMGFNAKQRRMLLGCGAAAAVSASFNAPVAGVLFALEVVLGNYALSVFGPIAAASVVAAIVTRAYLGDFPAFAPPAYGVVHTIDVPLAAALGLLSGLIASGFLLSTQRLTEEVRVLAQKVGVSLFLLPPIGGLIIGLMGAYYPEVYGVGYEAVTNALAGKYAIATLAALVLFKCLATSVTLSCRFGGGVFSPGVVIGAFAGAAFGGLINQLFPGATASADYYAMVGMGAVAGAILGAPISTTLIAFELTGEYGITISLMVAVAISTLMMQWLCGRSFFHWQLSRRGYDLSEGPHGVILQTIRVRDVMEKMPPGSAPLPEKASRLETGQSLGEALALLNEAEETGLPVVDAGERSAIVGYLSRVRTLAAYNKALIEQNIEHHT